MALTVAHGGSPPMDAIRELLKHPSIDVNAPGGNHPLMVAALHGRAVVVAILLQHPGINDNAASPPHGNTCLHVAAHYGDLSVVRELLQHPGIDLGLRNRRGKTAHQLVGDWGDDDVVCAIADAMAS